MKKIFATLLLLTLNLMLLSRCQGVDSVNAIESTTNQQVSLSTTIFVRSDNYTTQPDKVTIQSNETSVQMKEPSIQLTKDFNFNFSLTPTELLEKLSRENIKLMPPTEDNYTEIRNPVKDGRIYNFDESFWYKSDEASFFFDENGQLSGMVVKSKRFSTEQGICVGDKREKVFSVYPDIADYCVQANGGYLVFGFGENQKDDVLEFWAFYSELQDF